MKFKKWILLGLLVLLTISVVNAADTHTLTVQDTDTNGSVYWKFTGIDSEAYGQSYKYCLITTDDGNYYLDANYATNMWKSEPTFSYIDKAVGGLEKNGKYYMLKKIKDGFCFKNTNNMTIEWQKGKDIGIDNDTREITSITIDGKKIF